MRPLPTCKRVSSLHLDVLLDHLQSTFSYPVAANQHSPTAPRILVDRRLAINDRIFIL
jgi:hypothetical protein